MKKALKRNSKAVTDKVIVNTEFSLPVICKTAKLNAVSVAGYDAFTIGLSSLSSSLLAILSPHSN